MAMDQATARQQAIAAGANPADVDAFIAKEGGARTSAQRITSAFGVAGSTGTNDLSTFGAQKAANPGGTYNSGATPGGDSGGMGSGPSSATGFPTGSGGGGIGAPGGGTVPDSSATDTSTSALSGLTSALGMSSGITGATAQTSSQPAEQPGAGLRQNLGNRLYPTNTAALAGLQRAY